MTYKEVDTLMASFDLPYAYYQFTEDTAQPPPFLCFYYPDGNDFLADNINYQRIRPLTIELYTDNKDIELEDGIENTLSQNGLVYRRNETFIESEKLYMVTFETEIVITEELPNG